MTVIAYSYVDREYTPLSKPRVGLARFDASSARTAASASARRRWGIGLVVALVVLAFGLRGGVASAHSVVSGASTRATAKAPLRAIFYSAAPARSRAAARRALTRRAVARQLAALRWARADVAIMPWSRPGSAADRAFRAVITAGAKHRRHVRAAALINRLRGTEAVQIKALASRWASARGYLHIGSRPARVRRPRRPGAARLRGGAALASSSSGLLARAGDVHRVPAVQQRRQRVVLRPPPRIQRTSPWHVPDPAGLPAQACGEIASAALAQDLAACSGANERLRRAPSADRLAQRLG